MEEQGLDAEQRINPDTLKRCRKNQNLTQQMLADKCRCSAEQISRWERGKGGRVQPRLREPLAKALRVQWERLTRPPDDGALGANEDVLNKVKMNFRVEPKVRTALALVCRRYSIQPSEVIALAPLLMMLTAEKSLAWRRANLQAAWAGFNEMQDNAPHLSGNIALSTSTEMALDSEEESIERRDVFGRRVETEIAWPGNPFMEYMSALASNLDEGLLGSVETDEPELIYYTILEDDLKSAGVLGSEEGEDESLLSYFRNGAINFEEALSNKEGLTTEDYSKWLGREKQRIDEESRAFLAQF